MQKETTKSLILIAVCLLLLFLVAAKPGFLFKMQNVLEKAEFKTSSEIIKREPLYAGVVSQNTSFFDLLREFGFDPPSINIIEKAARNVYDFRRIYPGQPYEVYTDENGNIESMRFGDRSNEAYIDIRFENGIVSAEKKEYEFDIRLRAAGGTITTNLFSSLDSEGLPTELGNKIADIFAWDIDFHNDMRRGDYFKIIFEEKTRKDGFKKMGNIVAAEFFCQGKSHYAFLFRNGEEPPDYYDENGKSLRKQLLRAPLSYTRISSNFSSRRFHPVLHHYAPHYGVDYAAPVGTPVMATGTGTVIAAQYAHGNGNYVKIKHASGYITYYLHLSRFGKGIHPGARVEQGQVIGYVGATGYATGPHLDYRVMKGNRFVNPRTISLPPAAPVSRAAIASFLDTRDRHMARLLSIDANEEALTESKEPDSLPSRNASSGRGKAALGASR